MRIVADDIISQVNSNKLDPPNSWHSRRLYIGEQGASNWLNVVRQPTYPLHGNDPFGLSENLLLAIEGLSVRTMVSLGPGDAHHDISLVRKMKCLASDLRYLPVDISKPLLDLALQNMEQCVSVPAGLLCDYENWGSPVWDALPDLAQPPILFSLLGGGFGNLDKGERSFLVGIRQLMKMNDRLLMDVPLAGPAWTANDDPRLLKSEYRPEFKRFLSLGLPDSCSTMNESMLEEVENRISCDVSEVGDVTGTKVIVIRDRTTERELLRFCRYNWESLIGWLTDSRFDVLFHRTSINSDADKFGMGVVLLGCRAI